MCEVLLPDGKLDEICGMKTVCEKFVDMEESRKRVWAGTKDIDSANGVMLDFGTESYFIGNIDSNRARGIMAQFLKEGYLDCTSLGLKAVSGVSEIKEGVPYGSSAFMEKLSGHDSFCMSGVYDEGAGCWGNFQYTQPGLSCAAWSWEIYGKGLIFWKSVHISCVLEKPGKHTRGIWERQTLPCWSKGTYTRLAAGLP